MAEILVCDDQDAVRLLLRQVLEHGGHAILEASDGIEAVALAKRSRPDLIILDMLMPGQSGLDVLEQLREDSALEAVPVLLLTGAPVIPDSEAAASFGASAYLAKPFELSEFRRTVCELLAE